MRLNLRKREEIQILHGFSIQLEQKAISKFNVWSSIYICSMFCRISTQRKIFAEIIVKGIVKVVCLVKRQMQIWATETSCSIMWFQWDEKFIVTSILAYKKCSTNEIWMTFRCLIRFFTPFIFVAFEKIIASNYSNDVVHNLSYLLHWLLGMLKIIDEKLSISSSHF